MLLDKFEIKRCHRPKAGSALHQDPVFFDYIEITKKGSPRNYGSQSWEFDGDGWDVAKP